mmetsp:Transcript_14361/g.22278  ORF Transcript_14361/g.22278 Transcript_14361/m.22278 type:complete len:123 (+) Transcript_14361:204-572(+)|eukprot:CAMPEP_0184319744 /NCGR_PEP_ID=MMETSP1049-20130417/110322_1 /TAXON_ID=77928 /ORGANISM="Proteomonas sulcata, Strain CCMP704" /LENGTH=122 /DNA_ID=CAMNT_0026640021 /DNA_START=105 /DNA_END=473 /DNA_ORIENTATION=+
MSKKAWSASRTDWKDPNHQASSGESAARKDVKELTKDVSIDSKKEAFMSSPAPADGSSGADAAEGSALEDKLNQLKDQLLDLRGSIKDFEVEFDQRLDACLQQIVSQKMMIGIGGEGGQEEL